jgi:uncharacterized protein YukE
MSGHTDFARYNQSQLVNMLYASDPVAVVTAGDTWAAVGRSLHDRAADVEQQLRDFQNMWTGEAADQYKIMIRDLADGIRQVATTALTVRDLTYSAAEALQDARRRMPAAVDRNTQQAQATSDVSYAQAVQVMTDLAGQYATVEASMPPAPAIVAPPMLVNGVPTQLSSMTLPGMPGASPPKPPLFGGVFNSGLAAAALALGGRFGAALPSMLSTAAKTAKTDKAATAGGGTASHSASLGKLTSIGSGPSLNNPLTSSPGAPAVAGLTGAVGAAAAAKPMMGGMPMMPMGMMGAGDGGMDGGRRIPPWLVETEDVWGESSVVAPSVIGDTVQ